MNSEQGMRKNTLRDACLRHNESFPKSSELPKPGAFEHFLADDKHKLIYCWIPKVTKSSRILLDLDHFFFLPPANNILSKVMFLHLSAILFTGGGVYPSMQWAGGVCPGGGVW